ncbi:MAG: MotA/TolQ/ExbB proton channel family protein [bacterium]|nr:MotA/TolQ/ExbB proton channel family protein [bacterium]
MDIATVSGIASAFALVVIAIFMGGSLMIFVDIPSVMITVGGTIGVSLIHYPLGDILGVMKVVKNTFFSKTHNPQELIKKIIEMASLARKEGLLALQNTAKSLEDPFIRVGIQGLVDGLEPEAIRQILNTDIEQMEDRHSHGAEILTSMAAYAPAMGLIGTLIGLVQMLQNLNDPSKIGPGMAVALLTTFYGAIMANMVFLPLSGKLKTRSSEEAQYRQIALEGIISISTGTNPRIIEQKLHAFLPPKMRISSFN